MKLTAEQKEKIRNAINDPNIQFYFVPSAEIKSRIVEGSDPILSLLAKNLKIAIMSCSDGLGVSIDPQMILRFINNELDEKNVYWLRMGDIRVIGYGDVLIKKQ